MNIQKFYHDVNSYLKNSIPQRLERKSVMNTHESHGPSGLDANEWRRLPVVFNWSMQNNYEISNTCSYVPFDFTSSIYISTRLTALDKFPSVRPKRTREVLGRTIGRTIIKIRWRSATMYGSEVAYNLFIEHRFGVLLIDAKNAFTTLNRGLALGNIKKLWSSLYTFICNSYREPSKVFINKQTVFSQEGTTHGKALAISMYGSAIIPSIDLLD